MANLALSNKEKEATKAFKEEHASCKALAKKYGVVPIGASFSYEVSFSSGIGASLSIKCPYCGEKKDITDVTCW